MMSTKLGRLMMLFMNCVCNEEEEQEEQEQEGEEDEEEAAALEAAILLYTRGWGALNGFP